MTTATNRIAPQEARQHVRAGHARLVCAYDSDERFQANHLEGAISLGSPAPGSRRSRRTRS